MTVLRRAAVLGGCVMACLALAAPAAARPEPVATSAQIPIQTGLLVLTKLGNFSNHLSPGIGQFFRKLGIGDGTAASLSEIQNTLAEINAKLDVLQNSVNEIRVAVEKARCENIQTSLGETQAAIKQAWKRFGQAVTAARGASKSAQMALAVRLRSEIQAEFAGTTAARAATRIHDALAGTAGSPSMVSVCGVAFQQSAGHFISSSLHEKVMEMVNYWQALEAQAAVLSIGLDVDADNLPAASASYSDTRRALDHELAKVKPSLVDTVLDTRTHLMWVQDFRVTTHRSAHTLAPPGSRLPYYSELLHLTVGFNAAGPELLQSWFAHHTPFRIPDEAGILRQVLGAQTFQPLTSQRCEGRLPFGTTELCATTLNLTVGHDRGVAGGRVYVSAPCYATWVRTGDWERYLYQS